MLLALKVIDKGEIRVKAFLLYFSTEWKLLPCNTTLFLFCFFFMCQLRNATEDEILTCHTKRHIEILRSTQSMNEEQLKAISQKYDYIYFHEVWLMCGHIQGHAKNREQIISWHHSSASWMKGIILFIQ